MYRSMCVLQCGVCAERVGGLRLRVVSMVSVVRSIPAAVLLRLAVACLARNNGVRALAGWLSCCQVLCHWLPCSMEGMMSLQCTCSVWYYVGMRGCRYQLSYVCECEDMLVACNLRASCRTPRM